MKLLYSIFIIIVSLNSYGQKSPAAIYSKLTSSILHLQVLSHESFDYGSAFAVFKPGYAITSWHIVEDATNIIAICYNGRKIHNVQIVTTNIIHDLALLKFDPPPCLKPVTLSSEIMHVGDKLYAIGSPYRYRFAFVDGLLSQFQWDDGMVQYLISCPFGLGSSGGPIINTKGKVVGIAYAVIIGAENMSFAIPAKYIMDLKP